MALCLKYLYCFGLYLSVLLTGIVSGEIDGVYKFLSWKIDDVSREINKLKDKVDNIDGRVKHVEEKLQGLHTTTPYLIDLRTEHGRQELETKVNENSKMQALAVEKMLSKEKVLLRKSMENFTAAFAEMKSEIQTQMSVFNSSFKEELGRIGTSFDHLKSEVRSEIMEYNKTLSEDISDINAILETNLKDMYESDNNNSMLLMKGIAELTSDWNSTTHNISQIIQTMEGNMVSNIGEIEKRLIADVKQEQNKTLQSISTLHEDVQSLSRNISTVTSDLSSRISSEFSSLSSQISSHSNRIYRLEENINECSSEPCRNGGVCADNVNGYNCTCQQGYEGINCETDINECISGPCKNGGICADNVNGYTCTCQKGFAGINCETDINECASGPCNNGGLCSDKVNGYTCTCQQGYRGINCETDINECASGPCENGGLCADKVNGYTCTCQQGYTGINCETVRRCLDGWWRHCYYVSNTRVNTTDALARCNSLGGYLAEIEDDAEISFLQRIITDLPYWWYYYIGLNDIQQEGNYSWFGTNRLLSQTRYLHWARDQPDNWNGNEDCVMMGTNGYWYDVPCTNGYGYICEIRD